MHNVAFLKYYSKIKVNVPLLLPLMESMMTGSIVNVCLYVGICVGVSGVVGAV